MNKGIIIGIIVLVIGVGSYMVFADKEPLSQVLPTTCTDEPEGMPVITSVSSFTGKVGDTLEVRGCNFNGFEGDTSIWIENAEGVKGILAGVREEPMNSKVITVTLPPKTCQTDNSYSGLPCEAFLPLSPGVYSIYTYPWGKKSNVVSFTIN